MGDMLLSRALLVGLVVTSLVSLSGCSLRKFGYELAGKYVSSRMVDTFGLDGQDKSTAERVVREIHKWHRKEELPRYATLIDGLVERLRDGMSDEDFRWLQQQGDEAVARLAKKFAPPAAEMLTRLREDQVAHAEKKMSDGEKERFAKLDQSEDKYYAYRLENTKKTLKTWLGSYTDEQLQIFATFHREDRAEEIKRREVLRKNRAHLLEAVRSKKSASDLSALIYHWLTTRQTDPSPDFQQSEQRQEERYAQLLRKVDRTLSEKQRLYLLRELGLWRQDFLTLAAE